jgi:hypothetical protein
MPLKRLVAVELLHNAAIVHDDLPCIMEVNSDEDIKPCTANLETQLPSWPEILYTLWLLRCWVILPNRL